MIPAGYDQRVRDGETVPLPYLARPAGGGEEGALTVAAAVDAQSVAVRAARLAEQEGVASFDAGLDLARTAAAAVPQIRVRTTTAGGEELGGSFDYGAAQELVLFVFLISLAASTQLIESRRFGVSRRMLSTPTPARTILAGEMLGRYVVALVQGLIIVFVTLVLFGVDWGDPVATGAIVAVFALVGAGAAMLMGSVLDNQQQAGSFGVFFGLLLAALGGSMVPLEVFPETVRTIAHATPHAWAIDAFGDVLGGSGIGTILPELGILLAYAAVLLVVAVNLFRRRLTA